MVMKWFVGTALAVALALPAAAQQLSLGIVGFQMSSETHARVVNAAEAAAKAKGWHTTVLNSQGGMPQHAAQVENLIQAKVDAIILAMGKPVQLDEQLQAAKKANIPVITVMSGNSPHSLFDIVVNEYAVGADAALYLLGSINYEGNVLLQRFEGNVGTRIRGKVLDAVLEENTAVKVLGAHSMARTASWREDVKAGMEALLLKHGKDVKGIWASFDGQAFIIDDLLTAMGRKPGEVALVSIDGGQETFARLRDAKSHLTATVAIPFETMGVKAVEAVEQIVVKKAKKDDVVKGPYLYLNAVLVDRSNVPAEGKWPW